MAEMMTWGELLAMAGIYEGTSPYQHSENGTKMGNLGMPEPGSEEVWVLLRPGYEPWYYEMLPGTEQLAHPYNLYDNPTERQMAEYTEARRAQLFVPSTHADGFRSLYEAQAKAKLANLGEGHSVRLRGF